jgi:hypothetical protein
MGDLYEPKYAAYALGIWGVGAVAGPVLGPMLGVSWNLGPFLKCLRQLLIACVCSLQGFTFSAHGWTWVHSSLLPLLPVGEPVSDAFVSLSLSHFFSTADLGPRLAFWLLPHLPAHLLARDGFRKRK